MYLFQLQHFFLFFFFIYFYVDAKATFLLIFHVFFNDLALINLTFLKIYFTFNIFSTLVL